MVIAGLMAARGASAEPAALPRDSWLVRFPAPAVLSVMNADAYAGRAWPAQRVRAAVAEVEAAQAGAVSRIADLGARVVDGYQLTYNGLLVHADARQAGLIARLPGVEAVAPAPILAPAVRDLVRTVKADEAIQRTGFDGRGSTVAVVDTGIDYEHAMLGGDGDPEAYLANDEDKVERGSFPTEKVIGGLDLAGAYYSASCAVDRPDCRNQPQPDGDPLDPASLGHGSHVAGIIAGVEAPPRVPGGVAPGAGLVALKIFGNPRGAAATSDLALSALEWVARHNAGLPVAGSAPKGRIDVINLSLGTDFSTRMVEIERAVTEVVEAGISVVASAGNAGPLAYVTGSPGSASLALSVGSSLPMGNYEPKVAASWRQADGRFGTERYDVLEAAGDWLPGFGEGAVASGDLAWMGQGCDLLSGLPLLSGKIALIERGGCTFYDKLLHASMAGAIGAVVFTDATSKASMGCAPPSPCSLARSMPAGMIDREPGIALRDRVLSGAVVRVQLEPVRQDWLTDTVSPFSSRGPARLSGIIKPDLTAPGSGITSARAGGGTRLVDLSGTSMAGPAAAGILAQLWQRNRQEKLGLGAADLAALLMNHADAGVRVGRKDIGILAPVMRQGAGRADALRASLGQTVARGERGLAGLSFGLVALGDDEVHLSQTMRVRNLSEVSQRYRPEMVLREGSADLAQGASMAFEPPVLQVGPRSEGQIRVTLVLRPEDLRPWALRGTVAVAEETAFNAQEVDGYVLLQAVDQGGLANPDGDRVSLPFQALPRRHPCARSMQADAIEFWEPEETTFQNWRNGCSRPAAVEPYFLVGQDRAESVDLAGDPGFPAKLDLEAVGLRFGAGDDGGQVSFALKTRGPRRIPAEAELRVFLDGDSDGRWDRVLFQRYSGNVDARLPAGQWLTLVAPLAPGSLQPDEAQAKVVGAMTYDLDESVSVLSAPARLLGIDPAGNRSFDWAALALDAVGDYPLLPGYPGYDLLPDDLAAGGREHYDGQRWACLSWTDPRGAPLGSSGLNLALDVGAGVAGSQVRLRCEARRIPEGAGLFMHYPANRPSEQVEIRLIRPAVPILEPSPTPQPSPSASPVILPPSVLPPSPSPGPTEDPIDPEPSATPRVSPSPTRTAAPPTVGPSATPEPGEVSLGLRQTAGGAVARPVAGWPVLARAEVAGGTALDPALLRLWAVDASGGLLSPASLAPVPAPDGGTPGAVDFLLPLAWTTAGPLRLHLLAIGAPPHAPPLAELAVAFRAPPPLEIVIVPIELQAGGVGPVSRPTIGQGQALEPGLLARALPLPLSPRLHAPLRFTGQLSKGQARLGLLQQLAQLRALENGLAGLSAEADGAPLVIGLVPAGLGVELALPGGGVALASAGDAESFARAALMALGLPAIACDGAAARDTGLLDPTYPHTGGRIGGAGLDLALWREAPASSYDLLSACRPAWLSGHHLQRLLARLDASAALAEAAVAAPAPPPAEGLRFSGMVRPSAGQASLDPPRWTDVPTAAATEAGSGLQAWILDAVGAPLYRRALPSLPMVDGLARSGWESFGAVLPRLPGAAAVSLRGAGDVELARAPLAGEALRLDPLYLPGRGQAGQILLGSTGALLDVAYSPDGKRWEVVNLGAAGARLELDTSVLQGSANGLVEVSAHLRGQTLRRRLPIGAVAPHAPSAHLPVSIDLYRPAGAPIVLPGLGLDADGEVAAERLQWEVPALGIRQAGRVLVLPQGLPAGDQVIRFTVLDDAGLPGASQLVWAHSSDEPAPVQRTRLLYMPRVGKVR